MQVGRRFELGFGSLEVEGHRLRALCSITRLLSVLLEAGGFRGSFQACLRLERFKSFLFRIRFFRDRLVHRDWCFQPRWLV